MLDLNNVPEDNKSGDFELIPVGTVVRAIVKLKGGTTELPKIVEKCGITFLLMEIS